MKQISRGQLDRLTRDAAASPRRRMNLNLHADLADPIQRLAIAMQRVRSGELGWTLIDDLHRMVLDDLLPGFGLAHLNETARRHLNKVWHRLGPWPDSVAGLTRLKSRFTICTLSNGNLGLLTNMAKRAGLP